MTEPEKRNIGTRDWIAITFALTLCLAVLSAVFTNAAQEDDVREVVIGVIGLMGTVLLWYFRHEHSSNENDEEQ